MEDGLFTAVMDFGPNVFQSQARWLGIKVQCTGDGAFVPLSPRVELTGAPQALDLRLKIYEVGAFRLAAGYRGRASDRTSRKGGPDGTSIHVSPWIRIVRLRKSGCSRPAGG